MSRGDMNGSTTKQHTLHHQNSFNSTLSKDGHDERGSLSGSDDGNYASYPDVLKNEGDNDSEENNSLIAQTLNTDGTPKRPMNAFMIFARRRRPQVSAENQAMRTGEVSKILSKEWSVMPANEKQFYQDQARQLKEWFNSKYPDYVYRRRPNHSRRPRRKPEVPTTEANNLTVHDVSIDDGTYEDSAESPADGEDSHGSDGMLDLHHHHHHHHPHSHPHPHQQQQHHHNHHHRADTRHYNEQGKLHHHSTGRSSSTSYTYPMFDPPPPPPFRTTTTTAGTVTNGRHDSHLASYAGPTTTNGNMMNGNGNGISGGGGGGGGSSGENRYSHSPSSSAHLTPPPPLPALQYPLTTNNNTNNNNGNQRYTTTTTPPNGALDHDNWNLGPVPPPVPIPSSSSRSPWMIGGGNGGSSSVVDSNKVSIEPLAASSWHNPHHPSSHHPHHHQPHHHNHHHQPHRSPISTTSTTPNLSTGASAGASAGVVVGSPESNYVLPTLNTPFFPTTTTTSEQTQSSPLSATTTVFGAGDVLGVGIGMGVVGGVVGGERSYDDNGTYHHQHHSNATRNSLFYPARGTLPTTSTTTTATSSVQALPSISSYSQSHPTSSSSSLNGIKGFW